MSLPSDWIDAIFDQLTVTYGQQFLRRWDGVDMSAVKEDWARKLSGFAQHPYAIRYALDNLPSDHAPGVLEFRAIARRAPAPTIPKLDAPRGDPERVHQELSKMREMTHAVSPHADPLAWAKKIVARHEAGEQITRTVLRMAQDALNGRK